NPYAGYGFSQQGYNPYGGFMDPSQFGGYGYPSFPQQPTQGGFQVPQQVAGAQFPSGIPSTEAPGMLPIEESYIENILRLNKGKVATVYMTFEGATQKVFK